MLNCLKQNTSIVPFNDKGSLLKNFSENSHLFCVFYESKQIKTEKSFIANIPQRSRGANNYNHDLGLTGT